MLEINDLSVSFGDKRVLAGFSMTAGAGITALSGPSGCGKTTLLRVLAGLQKPDSGTVTGVSADNSVLLFQENRLLPRLNTRGQLAALLPRSARAAAEEWLAFAELTGEGESPVEQLSGGMQRRLALARACAVAKAASQGDIWLLLDEPFAGVDAPCAARIMERIRGLGFPVLLACHEAHVLEHCDRVVKMPPPAGTDPDAP